MVMPKDPGRCNGSKAMPRSRLTRASGATDVRPARGVQTWPTGRYDGELANGEPNGKGVLTLQKLRYEGEFRDGKPNGIGTLTAGSETVQGVWKDGCLQGRRKASIGVPLSACR